MRLPEKRTVLPAGVKFALALCNIKEALAANKQFGKLGFAHNNIGYAGGVTLRDWQLLKEQEGNPLRVDLGPGPISKTKRNLAAILIKGRGFHGLRLAEPLIEFRSRGAVGDITFRLLEKRDLPLVHRWLNEPHLKPYYQPEPPTFKEVQAKYSPRIGGAAPIFSHLALLANRPIGKIQCYSNSNWPEHASSIELFDGVSMDYFIGEPQFLKKGLGRKMVRSYVQDVVLRLFTNETTCYVCHDRTNIAAIRCSEAAGFKYVKDVSEKTTFKALYKRDFVPPTEP